MVLLIDSRDSLPLRGALLRWLRVHCAIGTEDFVVGIFFFTRNLMQPISKSASLQTDLGWRTLTSGIESDFWWRSLTSGEGVWLRVEDSHLGWRTRTSGERLCFLVDSDLRGGLRLREKVSWKDSDLGWALFSGGPWPRVEDSDFRWRTLTSDEIRLRVKCDFGWNLTSGERRPCMPNPICCTEVFSAFSRTFP